MNKAIFLDKDGTLIPDIPFNVNPDVVSLEKNAVEGLIQLQAQGYLLIVVSNQAGIAHGYFKEAQLEPVKQKLFELLSQHGLYLNGFYYCPHHPYGIIRAYRRNCECRKPQPGLLLKAAADWNIDLTESWMIGDILHDVEAGNRAGCKSILIDNGSETEWEMNAYNQPDKIVRNINQAANYIISCQKSIARQENAYKLGEL
ncbi:HAD family hydrolase [Pedobacter sp. BS3]|uniref:D-glycero-alpha-D-manno-heptose-1,7-bisphosphate 7-phosphatase n=1 Tax=Pedobacter sp. BS3 TaxID=2567937 RepID=UPI0011F04301|nr:HAD family hydrolase [Pedobacter sp. BS3]TZF83696.1 HAD family hydrolase [Pedobacter sp. BS3]